MSIVSVLINNFKKDRLELIDEEEDNFRKYKFGDYIIKTFNKREFGECSVEFIIEYKGYTLEKGSTVKTVRVDELISKIKKSINIGIYTDKIREIEREYF